MPHAKAEKARLNQSQAYSSPSYSVDQTEADGQRSSPSPDRSAPPLMELFSLESAIASDEQINDIVNRQVNFEVGESGLHADYTVLLLYDDHPLARYAADRIYSALTNSDPSKSILLVLNSTGGDVSATYLIAKLCREHTKKTFEIAVPRRAKSAATLICCGADKIHMGSLSELGPIDPQFGGIPALALKHSIEHIAQLTGTYPAASGMFSDYLTKSLRIEALGYFERVAESALQYAERLLRARASIPEDCDNQAIAHRLVYSYKDHGFVIDAREATDIFGEGIVVFNSDQYRLSNTLFASLDLASWACGQSFSREFSYIGSHTKGCFVWKKAT